MNEIMGNFEAQGHPGFPRINGVVDGTHIRIKVSVRQPGAYVNRKFHSKKIYCSGYCNLIMCQNTGNYSSLGT